MDILQKYKDKPFYEVPDHYFEQMQHDVMQRVKKETKRQKLHKTWISSVSVAASLALIVMLSYFLFLNKDTNEPFYVHEELLVPENGILGQDSSCFAEAIELETQEIVDTNTPIVNETTPPSKETIAYRAVDFYVDDYEIDSFCETMYDLECYYDY